MKDFLSPSEKQVLLALVRYKGDNRISRRANAILLKDKGWTYTSIADALFLDDQTIADWTQEYEAHGINGLKEFKYVGHTCNLTAIQQSELILQLSTSIYLTAKEVCAYVKKTYGVEYKPNSMTRLLKQLGFSYKKPKVIPGKADAAKQIEFLEKILRPAIAAASDQHPLYFVDGVHPVHNVQPAYGWILKGKIKEIRSNTGRQRVNINGAFCFHSKEVIQRQDESINGASTVALFKQIEAQNKDAEVITVIIDNARYNRSNEVLDYLTDPQVNSKINLVYLPPLPPDNFSLSSSSRPLQ